MVDGNNSDEGVFEIQNRKDGLGYFYSRGEGLVTWCAPRKIHDAEGNGNIDFGWGWWCPTDFLVNSYEENDPRENATVIDENDTILTQTYGWVTPNFDDLLAGTGCHRNSHKYEVSPDEQVVGPSNWPFGPIDVKLIRIADVYLWAAETLFEQGKISEALPYINAVRQRARNSGDDPSALPDLTESTLTHDAIVNERLVELAMEGHRFFDLVRWRLANHYLDHTLSDGSHTEFIEGRHEFYPIPETQISLSGGSLVQYSGWQ
jgi:hypothetical protein